VERAKIVYSRIFLLKTANKQTNKQTNKQKKKQECL